VPFANYAVPTIVGEIKRYFRDTGWTVRAPRRLQELGPQLASAGEELAQVLHRSPTTAELATRLGVSSDDVVEGQRCANAYRPRSFEQPAPGADSLLLSDVLGAPDPGSTRSNSAKRCVVALPRCLHGNGTSSPCGSSAT
jgi:RNA polymerase sigma-B factor